MTTSTVPGGTIREETTEVEVDVDGTEIIGTSTTTRLVSPAKTTVSTATATRFTTTTVSIDDGNGGTTVTDTQTEVEEYNVVTENFTPEVVEEVEVDITRDITTTATEAQVTQIDEGIEVVTTTSSTKTAPQ